MKNKIIAIGDIHGKDIWKKIVEQNKDADKIIFIGDYFDSFYISFEEQFKNFLEIIQFKRNNMDKVVLLFGNHDFHYCAVGETYSGYQDEHSDEIINIIMDSLHLMDMAYVDGEYLFTHAGVTETWCEVNGIDCNNIEEEIYLMFQNAMDAFKFHPSNPLDNTGDSITQSPIWVRPRALLSDKISGYKQVVGHTHQKQIDITGDIICIDVFDTKNEYLVINDGIPSVSIIS